MKTLKLTRRQNQILEYIRESLVARGFPPSIREIGEAVGLCSSSTVHSHLRSMEQKGAIRRNPSKPRSIQLLDTPTAISVRERVDRLEALVREAMPVMAGEWLSTAQALGL